MKKKLLMLLSACALALSGCSFVGGYKSVKHFVKEYMYRPVNDWILSFEEEPEKENGTNIVIPETGKEEEKPSESVTTPEEGTQQQDPPVVDPEADPILLSIEVSGSYKTDYDWFEEFDSTGIVVTATYDKGESKDVTSEVVYSGFDSETCGQNVVTVSYEDKTAEIILTIHYTVESVAYDFGELLGVGLGKDDEYWRIGVDFTEDGVDYSNTQASQEMLEPVVVTLYQVYSPKYLTLVSAKYYTPEDDYWGDGSGDTAYQAYLEVEEVGVKLISYCYKNNLRGQIAVFSIVE